MESLAGTNWTRVEGRAFDAGQEVPSPIGRHPMGLVMFTADRIMVAVTDARPAEPPGAAGRPLLSCTGTIASTGRTSSPRRTPHRGPT